MKPESTFHTVIRKFQQVKEGHWSRKFGYNFGIAAKEWIKVIGTIPIGEVSPQDILRVRASMNGDTSGWWNNTVRGYLSTFFNWTIACNLRTTNPVNIHTWARDLEITKRPISDFTHEEIDLICSHLSPEDKRFVCLACFTGLRFGTLSRLQWKHLIGDFLEIPREILKTRRHMTKDQRLYVPVTCMRVILPRGEPEETIVSVQGDLKGRLKRGAQKAGIDPERVYPHAFRRTWVAWMVRAGATREEVMMIQGWKDSNVLLEHYYPRVSDNRQKNLMEKL